MRDTIYRDEAIKVVSIPCRTCLARDSKDCEKCSVPKLNELINAIPSADKPQNVIAQITFDEEKLHEIIKEAIERFKKEYEVTDRPQGEWIEVKSYESEKHSVTDMRCNLCGKYSQMVLPHQTRCVYPRCPFCGARMKEINNE